MLIGTLCWAFYRNSGEKLPAYITKADQVFPYFITTHIPPGLAGLFMAALFGAAMANLSSDFNSLAAVGVTDYYLILRPRATDRARLLAGRSSSRFAALSAWLSPRFSPIPTETPCRSGTPSPPS